MKREAVKYLRDKAKSAYIKGPECQICSTTSELEFHHYSTVSKLYYKWIALKGYKEEDVVDHRDEFIADHYEEMYNDTVTLCKKHHKALHAIYGVEPLLHTAPKQRNWVSIQREKHATKAT